jgi:hypothetical protein
MAGPEKPQMFRDKPEPAFPLDLVRRFSRFGSSHSYHCQDRVLRDTAGQYWTDTGQQAYIGPFESEETAVNTARKWARALTTEGDE